MPLRSCAARRRRGPAVRRGPGARNVTSSANRYAFFVTRQLGGPTSVIPLIFIPASPPSLFPGAVGDRCSDGKEDSTVWEIPHVMNFPVCKDQLRSIFIEYVSQIE